jgi:hypothetical protein
MAGLPVGTLLSIRYSSTGASGNRIMLTHWYRCAVQGTSASIDTNLDDLKAWFADNTTADRPAMRYRDCLPNNCFMDYVDVQAVNPVRYAFERATIGVAGAHATPALSDNLSVPLVLKTAFGGRAQLSIKHIGPLPNGTFNDGKVTGAYVGKLSALGDALVATQTDATMGTWLPVIVHPGWTYDFLTGHQSTLDVTTMSRRTVRRGE